MLKCQDNLKDNITGQIISVKDLEAIIYFEKKETLEDQQRKEKEKNTLIESIKKRENLLNNANFISKAPKELVENEKMKLEEEKKRLATL